MGKFRKEQREQKKQADRAGKQANRTITGWVNGVLDKGTAFVDQKHDEAVALARYNRQQDFMEMCGVGEPSEIDYDNPHVRINWLLCDPVNVRLAQNPKLRYRFYEQMDEAT